MQNPQTRTARSAGAPGETLPGLLSRAHHYPPQLPEIPVPTGSVYLAQHHCQDRVQTLYERAGIRLVPVEAREVYPWYICKNLSKQILSYGLRPHFSSNTSTSLAAISFCPVTSDPLNSDVNVPPGKTTISGESLWFR